MFWTLIKQTNFYTALLVNKFVKLSLSNSRERIAIRENENELSNSRERIAIRENELSNSRERITNPWERIAQFDITVYLCFF